MTGNSFSQDRAAEILERRRSATTGYIADPSADPANPSIAVQRMRLLAATLGNPHELESCFHVAGSNGKTSTCHIIASIFRSAGYRTGMYSSPHLHTYRERIRINDEMISRESFDEIIGRIDDAASILERERPDLGAVSTFDLLTAAAFEWFARQKCEVAVIEVGLGGRFDPTNVVSPSISVITPIELEHTRFLGTDLAAIAENKAGIIKPGIPVVSPRQLPPAATVIERMAESQSARLLLENRDWQRVDHRESFDFVDNFGVVSALSKPPGGSPQLVNASTAICAVREFSRTQFEIREPAIRQGLATADVPGRYESVIVSGQKYLLDGAHTQGAIRYLVSHVLESCIENLPVVFGVLGDKDVDALLSELERVAKPLLVAPLSSVRSSSAEAIVGQAKERGIGSVQCDTVAEAMYEASRLAAVRSVPVLVTGSLRAVAEAREYLGVVETS